MGAPQLDPGDRGIKPGSVWAGNLANESRVGPALDRCAVAIAGLDRLDEHPPLVLCAHGFAKLGRSDAEGIPALASRDEEQLALPDLRERRRNPRSVPRAGSAWHPSNDRTRRTRFRLPELIEAISPPKQFRHIPPAWHATWLFSP
jgi:hypothetical protein